MMSNMKFLTMSLYTYSGASLLLDVQDFDLCLFIFSNSESTIALLTKCVNVSSARAQNRYGLKHIYSKNRFISNKHKLNLRKYQGVYDYESMVWGMRHLNSLDFTKYAHDPKIFNRS